MEEGTGFGVRTIVKVVTELRPPGGDLSIPRALFNGIRQLGGLSTRTLGCESPAGGGGGEAR